MSRVKTGEISLHFQGYTTILAATECCTAKRVNYIKRPECHMIYVR
jgi:hypothetical protein